MLPLNPQVIDVAQAIQLALGPAFLLTAASALLNVMVGRLARITDRGRLLVEQAGAASAADDETRVELSELDRRRRLTNTAIAACTTASLIVCLVIATLFLEVFLDAPLRWLAGGLFMFATLSLIVGLSFFLAEIRRAARGVESHGNRWHP